MSISTVPQHLQILATPLGKTNSLPIPNVFMYRNSHLAMHILYLCEYLMLNFDLV